MFQELFIIVGLYIITGIFELHFPAETGQEFSGRLRNVGYMIILVITGAATTAGLYYIASTYLPPMRQLGDLTTLQTVGAVFAYLVIIDFGFYWYHRAEHKFHGLWQIHELHHSDTQLNVTSGMRSYWLERPLQTLLVSIPASYIVGVNNQVSMIVLMLLIFMLSFTHANIRLRLGWLTPIICGPQLHRIHHSVEEKHRDKNFAQWFPIFDILFGTYYHPQSDEFPKTGTPELPENASLTTVMKKPFQIWLQKLSQKTH